MRNIKNMLYRMSVYRMTVKTMDKSKAQKGRSAEEKREVAILNKVSREEFTGKMS